MSSHTENHFMMSSGYKEFIFVTELMLGSVYQYLCYKEACYDKSTVYRVDQW